MVTKTNGQLINELALASYVKLGKVNPVGTLEARRLATGVTFYWRFTHVSKTNRVSLGLYDPTAPPKSLAPTTRGFSVAAAMRSAEELAHRHHANRDSGGHAALVAAEFNAKCVAAAAAAAAVAAVEAAAKYTLKNLLTSYCDYLKSQSRISHKAALNIFETHVFKPWPKLAGLPANAVDMDQIADVLRRVFDEGKGRTSNKLRAYMRAAFELARTARAKAAIPASFKLFGVRENPVSGTAPDSASNRARKDPLSLTEMRQYWRLIEHLPAPQGPVLRLHLLTGGLRIEQLLRLRTADIHTNYIVLFDGKGRPGHGVRLHHVPLLESAATALRECLPIGEFALSLKEGRAPIGTRTFSTWASAAALMHIKGFQARRIRSGVETLLAAAGVSESIRGRLQSHGLSGVQNRHYDGHDYLNETRAALDVLHARLTGPESI